MSSASAWGQPRTVRPTPHATASQASASENFFHGEAAHDPLQRFALLPLRMFVGVTFAYAGLQKLADPGYLDPGAGTYLGSQLQAFAAGSPIGFLINWLAVPHVHFIGQAVIGTELAVGLLVLAGLFTRIAAMVGALLSVLLLLSATWDVQPYFLGSDSIYAVAWVTMALAGDSDVFSLEAAIRRRLRRDTAARRTVLTPKVVHRRTVLLRAGGGLVGLVWILAMLPKGQEAQAAPANTIPPVSPADPFRAESSTELNQPASAGAPAATASPSPTALASTAAPSPAVPVQSTLARVPATTSQSAALAPAAVAKTAPPSAPAGTPVATMAQLQQGGGAMTFANRLTGQPGVLVDLGAGKVAACSAICTHAGCTVEYSARQRVLVCPCHGAEFDPAQSGRVLRGPARRPLAAIAVTAGPDGTIYLQG